MNERISLAGTHKAKVVDFEFGTANGKEQVALMFQITSGEHEGKSIAWFGYFTEKTAERTMESLRYCGWHTDTLADLSGVTDNEVEIVVEDETYEGKTRSKVKWVNRASKLNLKDKMDANALQAFAARMRGLAIASKQKLGPQAQPTAKPAQRAQSFGGARTPQQQDPNYGPDAPFEDDIPF